jgi:two-component system, LytTR family, response regulator
MSDRIRTIIVDDEAMSRAALRVRVGEDAELELIAECCDGMSAMRALRTFDVELLLLDIRMPGLDGFELIEHLDPERCPVVVFVTAHDEYALRAFDVAAVDYLLKPFDADRFALGMQRAKERVYRVRSDSDDADEDLAAPLARINGRNNRYADRFLIRENGRILFLPVSDVVWIESASNYLKLHGADRVHLVRMRMADLEELLDPQVFTRIHRSAMVRIDAIASMTPGSNGDHLVNLRDGTALRLSRTYRDRVFAAGVPNG